MLGVLGHVAAGIVAVLTLWDTQEDLDASESMVEKVRREAVAAFGGGTQTIERFEQTVAEVGPNPPTMGSSVQIRRIKTDPATVEDNLAFSSRPCCLTSWRPRASNRCAI